MRTREVLVLLFISLSPYVFGQGIDVYDRTHRTSVFFGINVLPAQSKVINEGSDLQFQQTPVNTISGSMEFGILIRGRLGISIGLRYSSFEQGFKLNQDSGKYNASDSEGDNYEMRWTGTNIQEHQKLSFIGVPVCVSYHIPLSSKLSIFVKGGMDFCLPIVKSYSTTGTYSFSGYYEAYNVLISHLKEVGFPSDLDTSATGNLSIKSLELNAIFSAGITYAISQGIQITASAVYASSISNLYSPGSAGSASSSMLATGPPKIISIMALGNKAGVQSIGFNLGLIFMFK